MLKPNGFTLIEILLFISASCALMFCTLPSLQRLIARQHLKEVVWQSVTHLHEARAMAIHTHQAVMLCPSATGLVCGGAWHHATLITHNTTILKRFPALKKEVTAQWQGFPIQQPYVVFLPDGRLENENGTFIYCINAECKKIIIAKSGRMRVA